MKYLIGSIFGCVVVILSAYWWGGLGVVGLALVIVSGLVARFAWPRVFVQVPEKQVAVVFRRGERAFSRFLPSGHHWLAPGFEYVKSAISTSPQVEAGSCPARAVGGIRVDARWKVTYSLNPMAVREDLRPNMARTLARNPQDLVMTHAPNCIQHLLGHYSVEALSRPGMQERLERQLGRLLSERLAPFGFVIARFIFEEIALPERVQQALEAAYERKIQAEAEAQALAIRQQAVRAFTPDDVQRQVELERLRVLEQKRGQAVVLMETRPYHPPVTNQRPDALQAWKLFEEAGVR